MWSFVKKTTAWNRKKFTQTEARPMTAEEEAAFDEAFVEFDKVFDQMDAAFAKMDKVFRRKK